VADERQRERLVKALIGRFLRATGGVTSEVQPLCGS
jgi:hypothetical protein